MQSYIKLFFSFREETSALTDAEIGRLVRQMLAYGEFGDTDGAMSGNERFLFPVYRAQIARDSDRYAAIVETRAECGRAGARAKAAKRDSGICRNPEAKTGKTTKKEEKEKKIKTEDEEKKIKAEDKEASAAATEGDNADSDNTEALEMYVCDNLQAMSPGNIDDLRFFAERLPEDVIRLAVDIACANGVPKWTYVRAILSVWVERSIFTLEAAKADSDARSKTGGSGYKSGAPENPALLYAQRAYSDSDYADLFDDLSGG